VVQWSNTPTTIPCQPLIRRTCSTRFNITRGKRREQHPVVGRRSGRRFRRADAIDLDAADRFVLASSRIEGDEQPRRCRR
jgi:hypothetical protein